MHLMFNQQPLNTYLAEAQLQRQKFVRFNHQDRRSNPFPFKNAASAAHPPARPRGVWLIPAAF